MTEILILATWMALGAIAAVRVTAAPRHTEPGGSRWGHVPVAMILGPLWLAVAADQQEADA